MEATKKKNCRTQPSGEDASHRNNGPTKKPKLNAGHEQAANVTESSAEAAKQNSAETTACRSVVDYVDAAELRAALETVSGGQAGAHRQNKDWILPRPDPKAEPQTLEGELARLLTLKSYLVLDAAPETALDRLTQRAAAEFGVPTSVISLVDLGRQYFLSRTGLAEGVSETPRDVAFCAHAILNRRGMLVVPDAQQDERFSDNPFVTQEPHLRFYAGAPLVSPEGYKLGTFCVEGPEPHADLTAEERKKLQGYAAEAMELLVQRRKALRDQLAGGQDPALLRHAAVTTNLGDLLFHAGDSVTAMQLFQESVQTILQEQETDSDETSAVATDKQEEKKENDDKKKEDKRAEALMDLWKQLSSEEAAKEEHEKQRLLDQVRALVVERTGGKEDASIVAAREAAQGMHPIAGLPCLFHASTKVKTMSIPRPLPPLVFSETFTIDLDNDSGEDEESKRHVFPLDERPFTVSLGECAKATLFNMGLIHYHWCRPDVALQFFHLAASVSHKFSPLKFDPVDLTSANNMAQIHHQHFSKPAEALQLLTGTLKRGNEALECLYQEFEGSALKEQETESANVVGEADEVDYEAIERQSQDEAQQQEGHPSEATEQARSKTRRLRRKLARTLLDIGHVHFFNGHLGEALTSCRDALPLLQDAGRCPEMAAAFYNMSVLYFHHHQPAQALQALRQFWKTVQGCKDDDAAPPLLDKDSVQWGDALQLQGQLHLELEEYESSLSALRECLRIRRLLFGATSRILVETQSALGKVYLAQAARGKDDETIQAQVDLAVQVLADCLELEMASQAKEQKQQQKQQGEASENKKADDSDAASAELSFEAAQILLDLGRAYQLGGDLDRSLGFYVQVLAWAKGFFGSGHAFVNRIDAMVTNLRNQTNSTSASKGD